MTTITASLLQAVMPGAGARAAVFADALEYARSKYVGDDVDDIAQWLAQVAHESGQLKYTREIADGSAYEGRASLGNNHPGDGKRFRGRGLIQLTGRDNYTRYGTDAHVDAVGQPELLEQLPYAADVAGWFWKVNNISARTAGSPDRVLAVTRIVNGGTNGISERRKFYALAKGALSGVQAPAPIEDRSTVARPEDIAPEKHMDPISIAVALLPTLTKFIPQLGKLFGSGSEVSERNIAAATAVLETVTQATGSVNALEAAQKISSDPVAQQAAQQAVQAIWFELTEAGGGGIDGARKAEVERMAADWTWNKSASFLIALPLIFILTLVVASILFPALGGEWPSDTRTAVATLIVGSIIGSLTGYYFGSMTGKTNQPTK